MGKWTARLRAAQGVNFSHTPPDEEPSKPSKPPFDPFEGYPHGGVSEIATRIEPNPEAVEADRIEALAEALTEKAGAFIGDGIEQAEADRLAVVVVQCRKCAHYRANRNNPEAGTGICTEGAWPLSRSARAAQRQGMPPYPLAPRLCDQWRPAYVTA